MSELVAVFSADFTRWERALEAAAGNLRAFDVSTKAGMRSLTSTIDQFSGQKLAHEAEAMVRAVQLVGGAARLTESEVRQVNQTLTEWIDKAERIGVEVPQAMRDIAEDTKRVSPPTDAASISVGKLVAGYLTAEAVIGTVKAAWRSYIGLISSSIDSFSQAEAAQRQLVAALTAQGTATPDAVRGYQALSQELQRTTVYSDDLITEMQSLLVQVGDVSPAQMQKALSASTNLASGLGVDLRTATMLVAKAFEGNTDSLKRYGIVVSEAELAARGIDAVLDTVQQKFGGQAAAEVDTYAGQVKQLANAWDDLKERLGAVAVGNNDTIAILRTLQKVLRDLTDDSGTATTTVGKLWGAWETYIRVGQEATPVVAQLWRWMRDVSDEADKQAQNIRKSAESLDQFGIAARAIKPRAFSAKEQADIEKDLTTKVMADINKAYEEATRKRAAELKKQADDLAKFHKELNALARDASGSFGAQLMIASGALGKLETKLSASEQQFFETNEAMNAMGRDASGSFGINLMLASGALGKLETKLEEVKFEKGLWQGLSDGLKDTIASVPQTLVQAFTGGGGIMGALKAIGVQIADVIVSGIGKRIATAVAGQLATSTIASAGTGGGESGGGTGAISKAAIGTAAVYTAGIALAAYGVFKLVQHNRHLNDEIKKANTEIEKLQANLLKSARSFDAFLKGQDAMEALEEKANAVGLSFAANWGHQGPGGLAAFTDLMEEVEWRTNAVAEAERRLADAQSELNRLQEDAKYTLQEMQADAQTLGINFDQLGGVFAKAKIDDTAERYTNAISRLIKASGDPGAILSQSAGELSKFVQQAKAAGVALPENMREWLEELARAGLLVDENGDALKDLEGIKFGDRIKTEAEIINEAMEKLLATIQSLVDALAQLRLPSSGVLPSIPGGSPSPSEPAPGAASGGFVLGRGQIQHFAGGGFVPRGTDTVPAMLTPGEMVLSRSDTKRFLRSIRDGGTPTISAPLRIEMDKRVVADVVIDVVGDRLSVRGR